MPLDEQRFLADYFEAVFGDTELTIDQIASVLRCNWSDIIELFLHSGNLDLLQEGRLSRIPTRDFSRIMLELPNPGIGALESALSILFTDDQQIE